MRRLVGILAFVSCALLLPAAAFAQASIVGTVKDSSGGVLPGVTVEAASPVLIEKTRSVVTDTAGNYRVENLRPGTYTVTFTLAGFSSVKRDGVDLAGSGSTTLDIALKVGAVEETITVTGETPIVDLATTTKQAVLDTTQVQALPTSRQFFSLARLVPGTSGGGTDVGGSAIADVGQSVTVHGSKSVDQRVTLNGVSIMTLQAGGNIGGQQPDVGSAAEVTVDTSSLSAEMSTGGIRINFIPKDGGNTFSDSTFFTFSNQSMQGNNFTAALQAAGLATPNKIDMNYDLNESIGGPILKDRIWFYYSGRWNRANTFAGIFTNANAFDPNAWTYAPTTTPAENKGFVQQNNLRITWQATPKIKIAGEQKMDHFCNCPNGVSATTAPESGSDRRFPRLRQEHAELTSPVTNKLLLEAVGMHLFERWGSMDLRSESNGGSLTDAQAAVYPQLIAVTAQDTGLTYKSRATANNTRVPNYTYRVAASYVTGTHAFKTGWNDTWGYLNNTNYQFQPVSYRVATQAAAVPNQLTEYANPLTAVSNEDHDFGAFVQDVWRVSRYTVNGAIRYDWFKTSFPDQSAGPGLLFPTRNVTCANTPTFCAQDNLNWKDLTYRMGVAWDIQGNGKTAFKAAVNKYLLGQTLNGLGTSPNPSNALVTSANRTWNDANHNYIPDECASLTVVTAQGANCGALSNTNFGSTQPGATFDPTLTTGFGHRQSNWEFSTSVQREILPRISIDAGYFRRIWQNFQITDNILTTAADYTQYNVVVPADPRLPGGGGYTVNGLFDVNPTLFGKVQNLNMLSTQVGNQYEHWNGFDISLNGRLQRGISFQFGISSGKDITDNCDIAAKIPEILGSLPAQFCHQEEPMQTSVKGFGSYTVPKIDVQVAATFRSDPGGNLAATLTANNAFLATNSTLGRTLSSGANGTASIQIVDPQATRLDRNNQLDLRFGKVIRWQRTRSTVNVDLYNALNSSTILSASSSFSNFTSGQSATWLTPQSIVNARLLKVSFTLDLR